jgi:radical SAM superfamily enzyme YgiQ (UPF0313 family)
MQGGIAVANIVIINPRFEASFWGMEHALPLLGKQANLPVACLPLLAALTPAPHTVTLMDENVEELDFDRIARADIVGLTGMSVQRFRMKEILTELKKRGAFVVVGGPWVTVQEDYFGELADVIFIGEAEETWPKFLTEWQAGKHQTRYEQPEKTDMTKVPTPRFDLLKLDRYMFGSVQFSRGCPFQCEFCDIIVTFGRRPRIKTSQQVLTELKALVKQGLGIVFIVDDNLIGNKKAIKEVLREVVAWQQSEGYPLSLFTEASLDLADDPELLQLMVDANFVSVFIGIESPNEAALRETKKFQNVRQGPTMLERVHIIQRAGMEVWSGMIMGFDNDDASIFDAQTTFVRQARIVNAMIGMLHAIPKTPLHDRLAAEGRLDFADVPEFGTNVIPLRLGREQLRDGYLKVMNELYAPEAYFDRLEDLYLREKMPYSQTRSKYWKQHPWRGFKAGAAMLVRGMVLFSRLMRRIPDPELRAEYRRRIWKMLKVRREPAVLFIYVVKCAMHYHHYRMTQDMSRAGAVVYNSF